MGLETRVGQGWFGERSGSVWGGGRYTRTLDYLNGRVGTGVVCCYPGFRLGLSTDLRHETRIATL